MRTSIKNLGIVTLGIFSVSNGFAKEVLEQNLQLENEQLIETVVSEKQYESGLALNADTFYFNPSNVLTTYAKTVEEVIVENNKIVETKEAEYQPLLLDKCIEDVILEDNQIIESTVSAVSYPLDFNKINNDANNFPQYQNKASLKVEEIKL